MTRVLWAAAWGLMLIAGAAHGQPSGSEEEGYAVKSGDVLFVSVWQEEALAHEVLVRPDGGFSFPLVGDIDASGKTVEQLRTELTDRLSSFISNPSVTVLVREINGNKIYVIGQVNTPGEFVVNPRVDVVQALSLAGGTTTFASLDDIFVLRRAGGTQRTLPFDYTDIAQGDNLEQNILLQSGDVVVVP